MNKSSLDVDYDLDHDLGPENPEGLDVSLSASSSEHDAEYPPAHLNNDGIFWAFLAGFTLAGIAACIFLYCRIGFMEMVTAWLRRCCPRLYSEGGTTASRDTELTDERNHVEGKDGSGSYSSDGSSEGGTNLESESGSVQNGKVAAKLEEGRLEGEDSQAGKKDAEGSQDKGDAETSSKVKFYINSGSTDNLTKTAEDEKAAEGEAKEGEIEASQETTSTLDVEDQKTEEKADGDDTVKKEKDTKSSSSSSSSSDEESSVRHRKKAEDTEGNKEGEAAPTSEKVESHE